MRSILLTWLVLASAMLMTLGKVGSFLNYFIEWMTLWGVFIALAVADVIAAGWGRRGALLAGALALQAAVLPTPPYLGLGRNPAEARAMQTLVARVRTAPGPVISDDMVLLLRAGRPVLWEPAIFAELASVGRWDERPFVAMIRARDFAFFITDGQRGDRLFDTRYTPAVAAAMAEAYPRIERQAGLTIHLPPE